MSLFNKRRTVTALDDDAIRAIHDELESVLSVAVSYDKVMKNSKGMVISLEGRIRGDLLAFVLYLSGINRFVDPNEVATVNKIFDIDLWDEDYRLFRKDVAPKWFETAVPASILLLMELGNRLQRQKDPGATDDRSLARALGNDLINTYALIGSAFVSADGSVSKRESGDLNRYLRMLNTAVNGTDADLPEGAARRTAWAHQRLFG